MASSTRVPDWLRQRARISSDKPAIVSAESTLTFAGLDARASMVAAWLREMGIERGDRVALLAGNSVAFAVAFFGISRAGAVFVPVNPRLTAPEIATQIADCEPSLLTGDPGLLAGLDLPLTTRVLPDDLVSMNPPSLSPMNDAVENVDLDALHSIIYTSGTTGSPKGAMLTHGNFLWNAVGSALNLGLRDDDRWLACMPLFHVGGLSILLRGVLYGMTVEVHESFDAACVNAALCRGDVTIVSLVSTMLRRMLDEHQGGYHPSLRCILLGGGPVPPDLVGECLRRGIPVAPTYGLTEAASQVSTLLPEEVIRKSASAGKPLMPVELDIRRADGTACSHGEAGEIAVSGPTVMSGYWRRPEATEAALHEGWLRTGDFGYVDEEGYLYVIDRRDDLIVTGGENVYPAEVEAVLESHPGVREAGVFALSDAEWGQQVAAAVVLNEGSFIVAEDLLAWCRERLASYKLPRTVRFVAELPRNASGKLLRRELRSST